MSRDSYNLGSFLTRKYAYLKYAYSIFLYGMIAISLLFSLVFLKQSLSSATTLDTLETRPFSSIHEPSGLVHLGNNEFLIVEDEPKKPVHRVKLLATGRLQELGKVKIIKPAQYGSLKLNDLEGISYDGTYVYMVTSHSLTNAGTAKKSRMSLVRFEYDDGILHSPRQIHDLKGQLVSQLRPYLASLTEKQIGTQINIEGLSWSPKTGYLSLALRSPVIQNKSLIVHLTQPDQLFEQQTAADQAIELSWLDLNNQGIRALSWDSDLNGYFIVTGRSKANHELWTWAGKADQAAIQVSSIDQPLPRGTEGLSALTMNKQRVLVVVIDDGSDKKNLPGHYKLIALNLKGAPQSQVSTLAEKTRPQ